MAGTKADWGDYDNDGDLDLAVIGGNGSSYAKIYRNNNGSFEDIEAELQGISDDGYVMWGDFDMDNDLDLLITGGATIGVFPNQQDINISYIYRNDNGVFVNHHAELTGVAGWGLWGDYDHDGDLDIALIGPPTNTEENDVIKIYNNDQGVFAEVDIPLQLTRRHMGASIDWGDYDNDGDEDLFVSTTGESDEALENWISVILKNDDGVFSVVYPNIHGVFDSHVKWGDYDADGDLDLAIMGINRKDKDVTTIYKNDEGDFKDIGFDFGGNTDDHKCAWGFLDWEDYDTDGDLDLLVSGKNGATFTFITKILRNEEGIFSDMYMPLPGALGYAIWGDYDNDFDPDVLIGGVQLVDGKYENLTELYINEIRAPHTITFNPIEEKTYGDTDFEILAESSADLEVKYKLISGAATLNDRSISIHGAGEVSVRAFHAGTETYNPSQKDQLILVKKAILTATANNESIDLGDAIPELGISYDGFVNDEDVDDLQEAPKTSTTVTTTSDPGTYTIRLSGGLSSNYELVLVDGVLTIEGVVMEAGLKSSHMMAYPNPTRDVLTIDGGGSWHNMKLYDLSGQQLLINIQGNSLDLSLLQTGAYILHLTDTNGTTVFKQKIRKQD
ncbi:FG-GAP-like repeat-containing protein [Reichenbachiella carrageenanivorans]|uniref:FG-GAP-like repeat-containing protein n=1 Tax=Reichenbachiella carrageenanivorans TaxID=2979869 RepID=A0ABY6CXD3_9BACT|nr:FG-GAP-like repeat-containing protein [Reichenbachiella carrageenanivorans]UXX78576.1 FG-GAP-like repeat-containing protein [Reichenbachiella carrageenanivorans]